MMMMMMMMIWGPLGCKAKAPKRNRLYTRHMQRHRQLRMYVGKCIARHTHKSICTCLSLHVWGVTKMTQYNTPTYSHKMKARSGCIMWAICHLDGRCRCHRLNHCSDVSNNSETTNKEKREPGRPWNETMLKAPRDSAEEFFTCLVSSFLESFSLSYWSSFSLPTSFGHLVGPKGAAENLNAGVALQDQHSGSNMSSLARVAGDDHPCAILQALLELCV